MGTSHSGYLNAVHVMWLDWAAPCAGRTRRRAGTARCTGPGSPRAGRSWKARPSARSSTRLVIADRSRSLQAPPDVGRDAAGGEVLVIGEVMRPHVTDLVDKLSRASCAVALIPASTVRPFPDCTRSPRASSAWPRGGAAVGPARQDRSRHVPRSRRSRRELGVHVMSVPRASYVMRRWLLRDRRAAPR